MKKIKVAVIMGGKTPEHEISLISGREVLDNIDKKKYSVSSLIVPKTGGIIKISNKTDVVFIAMHGPYGEDGTIQGMIEMAGLKYTGSGVLASALGMDKIAFRKIMTAAKIPIPKYVAVKRKDSVSKIIKLIKEPWFVKPSAQGSSVGASIARNNKELKNSLRMAFKYGDAVLVDEYIKGKELTCSVLGNEDTFALPVVEIIPKKGEFFDYESKYTESGADEIVPAKISLGLTKKIQDLAVKVHKELGCRGFSRVDFLIQDNKFPIVLEINTIPGLTPMSLLPKAAKAAGYSYSRLLDKIINYAL